MSEPATGPVTRRDDRRVTALDLLVMLGLLAAVLVLSAASSVSGVAIGLSVLEIAPLLLRRSRPMTGFWLVAAAMALQLVVLDEPVGGQVAMPAAVYAVAAFADRRRARIALAVGLVGSVLGPMDWQGGGPLPVVSRLLDSAGLIVATALLVIAPWALGTLTRTRRAYVAALIDRGDRLEREAAQQAELAASDERARIAREMHDVVAHGLSVMIVQADGARYAADRHPGAAERALETISATGRASLAEMRRMLGLLRSEDDDTGTRPQPGLVDLEFLLEQVAAAGASLSVRLPDPLPEVPAGVGLTTYRIVQEALTNVRKHAGPGVTTAVHVRLLDDNPVLGPELDVEIADDGRGVAAPSDGRGHGLIGMRERVAVHGGRLETGPRPGGGFRVWARIPFMPVLSAGGPR